MGWDEFPQKYLLVFYKVQKAAWLFTMERLSYIVQDTGLCFIPPLREVQTWILEGTEHEAPSVTVSCSCPALCMKQTHVRPWSFSHYVVPAGQCVSKEVNP